MFWPIFFLIIMLIATTPPGVAGNGVLRTNLEIAGV